jgi:hypothetical protein
MVLIGLGGLWLLSVGLETRIWLRSPSSANYGRAADRVRAEFLPGDVLCAAPSFALRPLELLGDLPGTGLSAMELGMFAGMSRLWVLAEPGAEDSVARISSRLGADVDEQHGPLRVLRFLVSPRPPWHGASAIEQAEARLFKASGPVNGLPCDQPHGRLRGWTCAGEPDWQRNTLEWGDLAGTHSGAERGIWMHPPARGDRKVLTWKDAQVGSRFYFAGSHTEHGARHARAAVHVEVSVDNQPILERDFPVHHGWTVERISVPTALQGAHAVSVALSTADNAGSHFVGDLGVLP